MYLWGNVCEAELKYKQKAGGAASAASFPAFIHISLIF